MKAKGRIKLTCFKKLPCGVMDRFTVCVMADKKDSAKREYESQGYTVK